MVGRPGLDFCKWHRGILLGWGPKIGFLVPDPIKFDLQLTRSGHKRPIASHFHSGGLKISYLGEDLDEADGESEEALASITVCERAAEHPHDVLSGD